MFKGIKHAWSSRIQEFSASYQRPLQFSYAHTSDLVHPFLRCSLVSTEVAIPGGYLCWLLMLSHMSRDTGRLQSHHNSIRGRKEKSEILVCSIRSSGWHEIYLCCYLPNLWKSETEWRSSCNRHSEFDGQVCFVCWSKNDCTISLSYFVQDSNSCWFLCSNPSLRVAYIDEVEEREGGKVQKVYYSVLVKAVDNLDQVIILWI